MDWWSDRPSIQDQHDSKAFDDGYSDYLTGLGWSPAEETDAYLRAYRTGWRHGQEERAQLERGDD